MNLCSRGGIDLNSSDDAIDLHIDHLEIKEAIIIVIYPNSFLILFYDDRQGLHAIDSISDSATTLDTILERPPPSEFTSYSIHSSLA